MTYYEFTKNGKTYAATGNNRFEAQLDVEMRFHLNLTGAAFKVFDKHNNLIYKGAC